MRTQYNMKICLINSKFGAGETGGAEGVVYTLAYGLKKAGHKVFVITLAKSEESYQKEDGIEVYRIKPWNIFSFYRLGEYGSPNSTGVGGLTRMIWHGIDMFNTSANRKVKKILEKEKPDVVNTHNLKGLSYLIPDLLRVMKLPHIHTLHDLQLAYPSGLLIKGEEPRRVNTIFLRKLYEKTCRKLFGSPSLVISPSKFLLDFYSQRGFFWDSESVVMPNPVPQVPRKGKNKETKGRTAPKKNIRLLFVGNLTMHKGVYFLIEVFKKALIKYPHLNLELLLAGSGDEFVKIAGLTHGIKQIIFLGNIASDNIYDIYKSAHITVVPSLTYENAPLVVSESLQSGTPVLASNIGGLGEMIREDYNGWLFEVGNQKSFSKKLHYILTKKNIFLSEHLAQNVRKSVRSNSTKAYVAKFERLVKQLKV
jgi:glycosyltransferase involved in cell wall biosynthesis